MQDTQQISAVQAAQHGATLQLFLDGLAAFMANEQQHEAFDARMAFEPRGARVMQPCSEFAHEVLHAQSRLSLQSLTALQYHNHTMLSYIRAACFRCRHCQTNLKGFSS